MRVLFIAGFAPIVRDPSAARAFYASTLGVEFEGGQGDYFFTDKLAGAKHFGVWPLGEAAQSCFGRPEWPADVPVPQATIEFEVDDVAGAARGNPACSRISDASAERPPERQTATIGRSRGSSPRRARSSPSGR